MIASVSINIKGLNCVFLLNFGPVLAGSARPIPPPLSSCDVTYACILSFDVASMHDCV